MQTDRAAKGARNYNPVNQRNKEAMLASSNFQSYNMMTERTTRPSTPLFGHSMCKSFAA